MIKLHSLVLDFKQLIIITLSGYFEVNSRATLTFAVLAIGDFLRLVRRVPRHTVLAIVASCIVLASLTNAATLKVC